jgi:hypothetical protein
MQTLQGLTACDDDVPLLVPLTQEIYGFMSGDAKQQQKWRHYDWSRVTTLAWADDDELTCHAHAKVSLLMPDIAASTCW